MSHIAHCWLSQYFLNQTLKLKTTSFVLRLEAYFFLIPCYHTKNLQQIHWVNFFYGLGVMLNMTTSKLHPLSIQINRFPNFWKKNIFKLYIFEIIANSNERFIFWRWSEISAIVYLEVDNHLKVNCSISNSVYQDLEGDFRRQLLLPWMVVSNNGRKVYLQSSFRLRFLIAVQ